MKAPFMMAIGLAALAISLSSIARADYPVLIPDSSWRVTSGPPGAYVHTRIQILDCGTTEKPATTTSNSPINTPSTMVSAYSLPSSGGAGAIAIVDAYQFPTALNDFNKFAKNYSLPQETSTNVTASTNKVFQVVYAIGRPPQYGGSYIESWNLEEALDIEWAHSIAPGAKIYLVEAASASSADMMYAVMVASTLPGVRELSMSWGGDETSRETTYDRYFQTRGITYFAAGGDTADKMEYPSASPYVVSVGGTTLTRNSEGVVTSEMAWDDTGCGISVYESRPDFQNVVESDVGSHRGSNDVAMDADPNTGVEVYDSTPLYGESGWWVVGGTSLATPCWAGVANLASVTNGIAAGSQAENDRLYDLLGDSSAMRDITSGPDGHTSSGVGWDQPTGIGSPIGLTGK